MRKNDIVLTIAQKTDLEQQTVRRIVQMTLDSIVEAVAREKRLELRDFGVFEVRPVKAHKARNPRTGDKVWVGEHYRVSFKAGRLMTDRVNQNHTAP
jgi:nucleoid DNA-binding protein